MGLLGDSIGCDNVGAEGEPKVAYGGENVGTMVINGSARMDCVI